MKHRKIIAYTFMIVSVLLFVFAGYRIVQIDKKVKKNSKKISMNTYIEEYDISKVSLTSLNDELLEIESEITNKIITIIVNEKEYEFALKDIGIVINKEELYNEILEYEKSIDYYDSYHSISKNEFNTKIFKYEYKINDKKLEEFINELSKKVNMIPQKGKLVMGTNRILSYEGEIIGYTLNNEESIKKIKENFITKDYEKSIILIGNKEYANDSLKSIDTKISTFTTTYDTNTSRKYNLEVGANFIDGVIINPGEIFSFYEKAGPFTRSEYVYYLGVIGNGVCQVATTLYNAQLLAGMQTVTRYHHGTKSVYVAGGLDATVASSKTFVTDYKFRNNHKYPIYISAYTNNGKITVEIWSNSNATNSITYKTKSVQIGTLSYSAYRYGYKNGVLVSTEHLGNSYYKQ